MTVMIAGIPATVDAAPPADAAPRAQASNRSGDPQRQVPFGPALDDAKAAAGGDEATETGQVESDEEASPDATSESTTVLHTAHLATTTDAPVSVQDHPTAKGESGEGSPSTGPTVEAAATPTIVSATEGAVLSDAQVSANATSPTVSDSTEAGGIASDVDGQVAVAGDGGTTPTRLAAGSTSGSSMATGRGPDAAAVDAANQASTSARDVPPAVDEGMSAGNEDQSTAVPAKPSDDAMPTRAVPPSGDGFDSAVAAARQEARTAGVAPTPSQVSAPDLAPTPGPLASAEGSLWDDVRLAFDRIRSSADGQEVRIRLRPAELGELVVQVRTNGDQVSVRLTASSAAAHQTLLDDRLRLATELAKAGFDEGSVDIGLDDGTGSFGDARHGPSAQDADGRGRGGASQ